MTVRELMEQLGRWNPEQEIEIRIFERGGGAREVWFCDAELTEVRAHSESEMNPVELQGRVGRRRPAHLYL